MTTRRIVLLLMLAVLVSVVSATGTEAKKPPKPTPTPPPDTVPPSPVGNLTVDTLATTHQSITLTWTATGDDGTSGQASSYLVRFALDGQMTEAKWDAEPLNIATALEDPYAIPRPDLVVHPAPSGEAESVEFAGLAADTTYYFGVKACDEAGNCSTVAAAQGETTADAGPGEWAIDIVNEEAWVDYGHRKDVDVLDTGQIGLWYADDGDFYHSYRGADGSWQHETVTGGEDEGCHSFAYSPGGDVWASTCVNGTLEVMHKDAQGTWVYEEVDGEGGNAIHMAHVPGTGEPALAFRRPGTGSVYYAWRDAGTWHVDQIDSGLDVRNPRLAFHPTQGYPSIAYMSVTEGVYQAKFAEKISGSWSIELVNQGASSGIAGSVFVQYHPIEGYPVIAHMGGYNEGVLYTYRTPSGWTEPEYVDAADPADTGGYDYLYLEIVLAFGDDGTAYLGHRGKGDYITHRFLANDGTGWRLVHSDAVVPPEDLAMLRSDPAVNPDNGMPVFTYGWDPIRIVERIPPDPGVSVGPTEGLQTTEAGGQATFRVRLDAEPAADVTIGLSSSDTTEGTVSPTSLTFTPANWNLVQTVTVTGVDDTFFDGHVDYDIATTDTSSTDPDYDGLPVVDVVVTNLDDDPPPVHTYDSTDTPLAIVDNDTTLSSLVVGDSYVIDDVDVTVDIAHTRDQDLDVFLIAPDGTRVELFTDVGGNGDDFDGTVLDDEASQSIRDGSAPFVGTYRPEGSLAALDGKTVSGTWQLEVTDDKQRLSGTLASWSISVQQSP